MKNHLITNLVYLYCQNLLQGMLGWQFVLVTLHGQLQLTLGKTNRNDDTKYNI